MCGVKREEDALNGNKADAIIQVPSVESEEERHAIYDDIRAQVDPAFSEEGRNADVTNGEVWWLLSEIRRLHDRISDLIVDVHNAENERDTLMTTDRSVL